MNLPDLSPKLIAAIAARYCELRSEQDGRVHSAEDQREIVQIIWCWHRAFREVLDQDAREAMLCECGAPSKIIDNIRSMADEHALDCPRRTEWQVKAAALAWWVREKIT